jgi:hypothetical protein
MGQTMPLTLELSTDLERRLVQRAAEDGADPKALIVELVERYLTARVSGFAAMSEAETKWFKQVNDVPRPGIRERWRTLNRLREEGSLEADQQLEMTQLYDQIEANHAQRLRAVAELAKLRNVSLDDMLTQLGLTADRNG